MVNWGYNPTCRGTIHNSTFHWFLCPPWGNTSMPLGASEIQTWENVGQFVKDQLVSKKRRGDSKLCSKVGPKNTSYKWSYNPPQVGLWLQEINYVAGAHVVNKLRRWEKWYNFNTPFAKSWSPISSRRLGDGWWIGSGNPPRKNARKDSAVCELEEIVPREKDGGYLLLSRCI